MSKRKGFTLAELLSVLLMLFIIIVVVGAVTHGIATIFMGENTGKPITHSYERNGHYYISFPSGVVHDPDCPCRRTGQSL